MAAENRLIEQIKKWVEDRKGKVIKIHQSGYSELGIPDLIVMVPGYEMCLVETKAPGKKPTPIQKAKIKEINKKGGKSFWCYSLDGFIKNFR